jgi:uncharacterized protein DUF3604
VPVYWGDIHGHSRLSDGRRSPDEYYATGRDEAGLDFCALSDNIEITARPRDQVWDEVKAAAEQFNEAGNFVTLLGYERSIPSWDGQTPGSIGVYFKGSDGPLCASRHPARDWLRRGAINAETETNELWTALKDTECFTVIHHGASALHGFTWPQAPVTEMINAAEVYSKWGSSEAAATPFPVIEGNEVRPREGGSARDALNAGFKIALLGGSDTRFGTPGRSGWEDDWGNSIRYERTGLTAVAADELSRDAVFDALKARRCYATTGERIELSFSINHEPMGSVLTAPETLRLHVKASGTQPIKRAEVFRNGELCHHKIGGREDIDLYIDDPAPTEPTWYYARVTQLGEDYAWSSPIWIEP